MSARFVRLTLWTGYPILVNAAHVSTVVFAVNGSGDDPRCTLWLGNEYGEGSQEHVGVLGTLEEVERILNGQVAP